MIVVLDTNVWVSALLFSRPDRPASVPTRALKRAVRDDLIATSSEIRAEINRVLIERGSWTKERASQELDEILDGSLLVKLTHNVHVCRDPKDDMFLECAALANADVLVTGDKDLLSLESYGAARIITPLEYVELPL